MEVAPCRQFKSELSPFTKKYIEDTVASGGLVQTKEKEASRLFKLPTGSSTSNKQGSTDKTATSTPKSSKKSAMGPIPLYLKLSVVIKNDQKEI